MLVLIRSTNENKPDIRTIWRRAAPYPTDLDNTHMSTQGIVTTPNAGYELELHAGIPFDASTLIEVRGYSVALNHLLDEMKSDMRSQFRQIMDEGQREVECI